MALDLKQDWAEMDPKSDLAVLYNEKFTKTYILAPGDAERYGDKLTLRVSLDHYTPTVHEAERGARAWQPALAGLKWLSANGFSIAVAGRHLAAEPDAAARAGYAGLFAREAIAVDAHDQSRLVLFPEMDSSADFVAASGSPNLRRPCRRRRWHIPFETPRFSPRSSPRSSPRFSPRLRIN